MAYKFDSETHNSAINLWPRLGHNLTGGTYQFRITIRGTGMKSTDQWLDLTMPGFHFNMRDQPAWWVDQREPEALVSDH